MKIFTRYKYSLYIKKFAKTWPFSKVEPYKHDPPNASLDCADQLPPPLLETEAAGKSSYGLFNFKLHHSCPGISKQNPRKTQFQESWPARGSSCKKLLVVCISVFMLSSWTTISQDVQTRFPVQLAFAKLLSKIKGHF